MTWDWKWKLSSKEKRLVTEAMNKFNRPRGNAIKQRKIKLRSTKKRSHVKEKDAAKKLQVGGKRTGSFPVMIP